MTGPTGKSAKGLFRRFRDLVDDLGSCEEVSLEGSVRLGAGKVKLREDFAPLQINLGGEEGKRLHLQPEMTLTAKADAAANGAYLLFDPDVFYSGISGFLRLLPGESLTLGREDPVQTDLLDYPKSVAGRHLSLKLSPKGLVLKDRAPGYGTCLTLLERKGEKERMLAWRREKLERLTRLLPGRLEPLARQDALELILAVIDLTEREPWQARGADGKCGGLLTLPGDLCPVFVGDLHARIDNLLVILTQNGFLGALEKGNAALVFLGDAVHPDQEGEEERMDSSMLMMDTIFRLKLSFPDRVFYLRGNHDSFSEDISKGGVPQGLLWEQSLREDRGASYVRAMSRLYDALPYCVLTPGVVACHAGPPTSKFSRDMLIDVRHHPKLEREITHVRLRKPNSPSGYHRGDVKRLRQSLGVEPNTPFLVGHTPLSSDDTLWLDAGGIANHHVLFGANPDWVGVIAQVGKRLLPMRYPVEPLHRAFNRLVTKRGETAE
jgi:hypothetical protein